MNSFFQRIKPFSLSCALIFICNILQAQNAIITFDVARSNFNNGSPLPAGETFIVTGQLPNRTDQVELIIFDKNSTREDDPLYHNVWKRSFTNEKTPAFYVPVNYKLRGSSQYDFVINYYRPITQKEYDYISKVLMAYLSAYVEQHTVMTDNKIKLTKNPSEMMSELNGLVYDALSNYKMANLIHFDGFSDIIRTKLEAIKDNRISWKEMLFASDSQKEAKRKSFKQHLEELNELLQYEVTNILNTGLYARVKSHKVEDYPVEETRTVLTLHAGYGGVYLDGDLNDLSYGSGGYAGITLPLGKKAFNSKFWSNTALVTGVYFNNFEGENGNEISGPIIKRPIYVGLGYKIFEFVRLTAGLALLEEKETAGGFDDLTSNVFLRPYIGLQADLNLWADFAR